MKAIGVGELSLFLQNNNDETEPVVVNVDDQPVVKPSKSKKSQRKRKRSSSSSKKSKKRKKDTPTPVDVEELMQVPEQPIPVNVDKQDAIITTEVFNEVDDYDSGDEDLMTSRHLQLLGLAPVQDDFFEGYEFESSEEDNEAIMAKQEKAFDTAMQRIKRHKENQQIKSGAVEEVEASESMKEEQKNRTLFVGNLPCSSEKKEVKELFKQFGEIESIRFRSIAFAAPFA
eukprot:TRINITY_DN2660_c0_g1_i5.p1 TRINITY_DN2660_c0_g1~~TRINITY_DN2660_c0_g1_i5.p1  ORF type:complete len:236 (-),score=74.53 TRINITY_DN2660_c0_g1_i5:864-1550(-)